MERNKRTHIKRRKKKTRTRVKDKRPEDLTVSELLNISKGQIITAKNILQVFFAVCLIVLTFSILFMGHSITSNINDLQSKTRADPNWYCNELNEKYGTEICYTSEDFDRIRPEAYTYYLDCSWGQYAIKTDQDEITRKEHMLFKIYGCDARMA